MPPCLPQSNTHRSCPTCSSLYYHRVQRFVDGKEVGLGAKLISEIPVGTIQLISVLNEKNAVAKYGEKAKDGAIEVTTKKK